MDNMQETIHQLGILVNALDVCSVIQKHDRSVFNLIRKFLVKVYTRDINGNPIGEGSGFIHGPSGLIVTAGHLIINSGGPPVSSATPAGVVLCRVRYWDGHEEDASVVACAVGNIPDLALLRGSPGYGDAALIKGSLFATSDTVYAFGFGSGSVDPNFSKGMVSCSRVGAVAISAHADNGLSCMC